MCVETKKGYFCEECGMKDFVKVNKIEPCKENNDGKDYESCIKFIKKEEISEICVISHRLHILYLQDNKIDIKKMEEYLDEL